MWAFYTKNKQTGQLIFLFFVTLTKKRKPKNGMNRTLENENLKPNLNVFGNCNTKTISVVKFQRESYKITNIFGQK